MSFKQCVFVVATLFIVVAASDDFSAHDSGRNILNLMANSNGAMHQDPSRSFDCFNYYIPLMEQLNIKYKNQFLVCQDVSQANSAEKEAATLEFRNELASRAETSCNLLSDCKHHVLAADVLQCYGTESSESATIVKSINNDAMQSFYDFKQQLEFIKYQEYRCTNHTKREYENENNKAMDDLNKCILGYSDVPSTVNENTAETGVEIQKVTEESNKVEKYENLDKNNAFINGENAEAVVLHKDFQSGET